MQKTNLQTEKKLSNAKKNLLYLVIFALLITNISTLSLALRTRSNIYTTKLSTHTYPLLDPAREFIADKDAITNIQTTRDFLRELQANEKDTQFSVYFEMLNTGANISINPDLRIYPASLVKLPIALAAVKKIEDGEWHWHNELVLLKEDLESHSGNLFEQTIGTRFTIETLIKKSLIDSDNTAFLILSRNINENDINKLINNTGLNELTNKEGKFSAKEYSRLFRSLYASSFLNKVNSQRVLNWLSEATFKDYLSSGLPTEVQFAHKYGENIEENVYSDSGIVYADNRPYSITVMIQSKLSNPEQAREHVKNLFKLISENVYQQVKNY